MKEIRFLTLKEVIKFHDYQLFLFGGLDGIRDHNLLESALYNPQSSFDGNFLYKNIFEMAAAYAHGIIKNHPFFDGNKRTGTASAVTFLRYNRYKLTLTESELYSLAINIATSKTTPKKVATIFKKMSQPLKLAKH